VSLGVNTSAQVISEEQAAEKRKKIEKYVRLTQQALKQVCPLRC
jgi:hypothetical protein